MYFYEFGYTTWEECPMTTIWHHKSFTKEEFDEMVLESFVKSDKKLRYKHKYPLDISSAEEDMTEDEILYNNEFYKYKPRISHMYGYVIEFLINDYGFNRIELTQDFIVSESDIVPEYGGTLEEISCERMISIRERLNVIEPRDNKIKNILNGE